MSQVIEIKVPDIGDYKDVPVIEVLVKPGDTIEKEQSIVVLESDKATMDVPSSHAGVVKEVRVKVGDTLSEGSVVVILQGASSGAATAPAPAPVSSPAPATNQVSKPPAVEPPITRAPAPPPITNSVPVTDPTLSHASPSVRKFARELGVTIHQVKGSGPKGRITQEDVQAYVKNIMTGQAAAPAGLYAGGAARRPRGHGADLQRAIRTVHQGEVQHSRRLGAAVAHGWHISGSDAAHGDAEDPLASADQVDHLVRAAALIDAGAVAHDGESGEVLPAAVGQVVDGSADVRQRDAGIDEALDDAQDEDVAEAVEPLRPGACG